MSGLRIRVLGGMQVREGTRELPIEPSCQPVLGYLLAHRGAPVARRELAETVWGNREREYALRCLSTALWRLKRSAGGTLLLLQGDSGVALNWQRAAWVDCIAFERRVAPLLRCAPAALGDAERARLARGLRCYRGDFLAGIDAEWALLERHRLRALYTDALHLMSASAAAHARWADAVRWGQRMAEEEPLREDVVRLLMHAHASAGNRALGLDVFRRCERTLRAELAVEPMPETRRLARELMSRGSAEAGAAEAMPEPSAEPVPTATPQAVRRIRRVQRALAASSQQLCRALTEIRERPEPPGLREGADLAPGGPSAGQR